MSTYIWPQTVDGKVGSPELWWILTAFGLRMGPALFGWKRHRHQVQIEAFDSDDPAVSQPVSVGREYLYDSKARQDHCCSNQTQCVSAGGVLHGHSLLLPTRVNLFHLLWSKRYAVHSPNSPITVRFQG